MPKVEAVVFDLDDTLYPERAYAFSGFRAVAHTHGDLLGDPRVAVEEMERLFESPQRGRVFNELLLWRGLSEDAALVTSMIDTYRTHTPSIVLYADADAALARVKDRYQLGLITDGPATAQWLKIDALGLRSRMERIIVTSELGAGRSKPDVAAFLLMTQRLGVQASCAAYVADNPCKDFVAPNALGWVTIQITRHDGIYALARPVSGGAPHHTITTLDALDGLID